MHERVWCNFKQLLSCGKKTRNLFWHFSPSNWMVFTRIGVLYNHIYQVDGSKWHTAFEWTLQNARQLCPRTTATWLYPFVRFPLSEKFKPTHTSPVNNKLPVTNRCCCFGYRPLKTPCSFENQSIDLHSPCWKLQWSIQWWVFQFLCQSKRGLPGAMTNNWWEEEGSKWITSISYHYCQFIMVILY